MPRLEDAEKEFSADLETRKINKPIMYAGVDFCDARLSNGAGYAYKQLSRLDLHA